MKTKTVLLFGLFFLITALVTPWFGVEPIKASQVWNYLLGKPSPQGVIFWFQRIPRVILALLAGGTLALVGAAFQVLFRNPLVEPYTLGISGGSALGAFLAISIPSLWITWGPFSSIQLLAVGGAGASLGLIYILSKKSEGLSIYTILLAGVTISIVCGGAILLLTYITSPNALIVFQRWMMGGVDIAGYKEMVSLLPFLLPGLILLLWHANDLNHISLGEDMALGHGVPVKKVQINIFIGGGLSTAAVVSLVGPIGFIGLIVPHAVRRLIGFDQRNVLPCSFFLGGIALAVCDTIARKIIPPTELPVGIITALIGGPLFIRLLVSQRWK
ncbi:MAG: iron ABC transporter permease [Candidatus Aminicenantes bacterium]|nr:iron ABC transporter permease [Candidatus Aminicenantes bacterium]